MVIRYCYLAILLKDIYPLKVLLNELFKCSCVRSCTVQTLQMWETWFFRLCRGWSMMPAKNCRKRWRRSRQGRMDRDKEEREMSVRIVPNWRHWGRGLRNRKWRTRRPFRRIMARKSSMETRSSWCIEIVACSFRKVNVPQILICHAIFWRRFLNQKPRK